MTSDDGLAEERTELAWQRTSLATAAGAALMARLTYGDLGLLAVATLGVALVMAGWLLLESRLRPLRAARSGRAPAWLAGAVALMATTEVVALLSR